MDITKFKILEIILQNRKSNFQTIQIALMSSFPEMSWFDIQDCIDTLGFEGYLKNSYADGELIDILVQPSASSNLRIFKETVKDKKIQKLIDSLIALLKVLH